MPSFASLRTAVAAKLATVTQLAYVYDHHAANLEGYPACTFDVSDSSNEFLTNKDNLRTITFKLVVYQETKVKGLDLATGILDATVDAIISAFENDFALAGAVDWCEPLNGPRNQLQTPNGIVIAQELSLKCFYSSAVT